MTFTVEEYRANPPISMCSNKKEFLKREFQLIMRLSSPVSVPKNELDVHVKIWDPSANDLVADSSFDVENPFVVFGDDKNKCRGSVDTSSVSNDDNRYFELYDTNGVLIAASYTQPGFAITAEFSVVSNC